MELDEFERALTHNARERHRATWCNRCLGALLALVLALFLGLLMRALFGVSL